MAPPWALPLSTLLWTGGASALAAVASRQGSSVTPVAKVVDLLEKLRGEIAAEGQSEAQAYSAFACFCKDKTTTVSDSISKGKDDIASLSATMDTKAADKAAAATDVQDVTKRKEQLNVDLQDTTAQCSKQKADYEAANADLEKAISSLVAAKIEIENSKSSSTSSRQAGLLAIKRSLELADAMKVLDQGPRWRRRASALLQEGSRVDPNDPGYKFHSQGIITILEKVREEFKQQKAQADADFQAASTTCDDTLKNMTAKISAAEAKLQAAKLAVSTAQKDLAATRTSLVQLESSMKDDQLYVKDLTKLCETRAKDWDQRALMRQDELDALSKALSILGNKVTAADAVNVRAFAQIRRHRQREVPAAPAGAATGRREGGRSLSFLQADEESSEQVHLQQQRQALEVIQEEGRRLGSATLAALAVRAAANPFGKVKNLIQRLIERLLSEATAEASKEGFCNTEIQKAELERTYRYEEVLKLNAELRILEAKKGTLSMEILDLGNDINATLQSLSQATTDRAADKSQNEAAIATAQDGLKALAEAILILKSFYGGAGRATVFAEAAASPVLKDTSGPGFEGAYRGKQAASKGIIGLLEVIESDFKRTVRNTMKSEAEASSAFVQFDQAARADVSGKETKVTLDNEDLSKTEALIASKTQEMQSNMDLVDKASKEIEALKPMCIDTGMSYADRVQQRQNEVAALKKALCILGDPSSC